MPKLLHREYIGHRNRQKKVKQQRQMENMQYNFMILNV